MKDLIREEFDALTVANRLKFLLNVCEVDNGLTSDEMIEIFRTEVPKLIKEIKRLNEWIEEFRNSRLYR